MDHTHTHRGRENHHWKNVVGVLLAVRSFSFIFFSLVLSFLLLKHLFARAYTMSLSYSLNAVLCCRRRTRHTHTHAQTNNCFFIPTHTHSLLPTDCRSQRKWANVNCTAFPILFHAVCERYAPARTFTHLCVWLCVCVCSYACIYASKAIVIGIMMTMFQRRPTVFAI